MKVGKALELCFTSSTRRVSLLIPTSTQLRGQVRKLQVLRLPAAMLDVRGVERFMIEERPESLEHENLSLVTRTPVTITPELLE